MKDVFLLRLSSAFQHYHIPGEEDLLMAAQQ